MHAIKIYFIAIIHNVSLKQFSNAFVEIKFVRKQ